MTNGIETDGIVLSAKLRVLIVDDERFVRFTLSAILRTGGYEVVEAASTEEALERAKAESFHVIVTDVMMGAVDGFVFRDGVRAFNKTVPIVFLTALVNEDNRLMLRVMEDVHSYYLSKNAECETILQVLAHATTVYRCEQSLSRLMGRIDREMDLASLIQRSVLPMWVHVGRSYSYGTFWKPLGKISGDLIEWMPLSPDSCLLVFGDISGHGTHSALAMMAVQVFLKQFAGRFQEKRMRPHQIVQELTRFFAQNMGDIAYMAGLVAIFDFATNEVCYHNAGYQDFHCFRSSTGERIDLNPERKGSLPIGMFPDMKCRPEDDVFAVFPDDAVFFAFSDGILDLSEDQEGERTVPQELIERAMGELAIESAHRKDVPELATELYQMLVNCGYAYQQDDIFSFALAKPQKKEPMFVAEVRTDAVGVDSVAQEAAAWMRATFGSDDLAMKVELLLGEHLMNVVSHGLDDNNRRHERLVVFVSKEPGMDLLAVKVLDHGRPWNSAYRVDEKSLNEQLDRQNENLAPHGRGIAIKRKLISDVKYRRLEGLNRSTFYIPLERGDRPAHSEREAK